MAPGFEAVRERLTAEQQAISDAVEPSSPDSIGGISSNRHHPHPTDLFELPNQRPVRALSPSSVGGVGSARGLAGMYAAATTGLAGLPPLLTPDTVASFGQIQSIGHNVVTGRHTVFAVGFRAADDICPSLGQGAFGYPGADGSEAFADPRHGPAYGYTRRRAGFPGGAGPENIELVKVASAAVPIRD